MLQSLLIVFIYSVQNNTGIVRDKKEENVTLKWRKNTVNRSRPIFVPRFGISRPE
jgi:hypothetical protein